MKILQKISSLVAGSAVLAAAAIASTGLAQADGYESKGRVVYERPYSWSGFYFGVHSGFAWSDIDARYATAAGVPTLLAGFAGYGVSHDTPIYGGQIGYQHQFGQLVVGVEGSISSAFQDAPEASRCAGPVAAPLGAPNGVLCTARFDDVVTIGSRLGWAMGKWMPYLTGGYATASFEHRGVDAVFGTPLLRSRDRQDGWYIGGGLDWAVVQNWTLGVEYRHYELEDVFSIPSLNGPVFGTPFLPGSRFIDSSLDTVTVRVSWKFGRPEPAPLK